jgi:hypothetical protein
MHKAGVHFLMEPNYISIGCHPRDQVPGSSPGTECINQSLGNYTSMDCPENKILALKLIRRDASAGSRTRVYCLEGNYPNRWTTNAADVKSVNHGLTAAHIYRIRRLKNNTNTKFPSTQRQRQLHLHLQLLKLHAPESPGGNVIQSEDF